MDSAEPLPPPLERFVREQLAAGRFRSEHELIRAAIGLLEASSPADPPTGSRAGVPDVFCRPAPSAATETWEPPLSRSPVAGAAATSGHERLSPRGLLADLHCDLDFDDIHEARSEMWGGLHPGRV